MHKGHDTFLRKAIHSTVQNLIWSSGVGMFVNSDNRKKE